MAEQNVLPQKTSLDKTTECPLCLHQLQNPKRLSKCCHSFCNACLTEVPEHIRNGSKGYLCPVCETFTCQDNVTDSVLLADLLYLQSDDFEKQRVMCKLCPDKPAQASLQCKECNMEMCGNCARFHSKMPLHKHHTVSDLTKSCKTKVVDKVVFCDEHDKQVELNCTVCGKFMCIKCLSSPHDGHAVNIEQTEVTLKKLLVEVQDKSNDAEKSCQVIKQKICAVRQKMEATDAHYEECKKDLDANLQELTRQLQEIHAEMKAEVTSRQKKEKKYLEDIKHDLECELSKGEQLVNLVSVTAKHAASVSLLQELRNGIRPVVVSFVTEQDALNVKILVTELCRGKQKREHLKMAYGELGSHTKHHCITALGQVFELYSPPFTYADIFGAKFVKSLDIKPISTCHRFSYIDGKLWVPHGNFIQVYDTSGVLDDTVQCHQNVKAVRKAHNGHIIFGGENGLFYKVSTSENSIKIAEGKISDVACYKGNISVLNYSCQQIQVYRLEGLENDKTEKWIMKTSFEVPFASDISSLQENEDHIFVKSFEDTIKRYTKGGKLVSSTMYLNGLLSGFDKDNNILLCHVNNSTLSTVKSDLHLQENVKFEGPLKHPRKVIVDSDKNIWILQGCNGLGVDYFITKFCRQ